MTNSKELTHPKYRADIDGLRAIAVILVVLFHASRVKGAFIGVDIFFVISGFLISTIIFNNLNSGSFSFVEFYSRRIRRIFPALSVTLLACLGFGWFALFADEYMELGKHVAGGAGFLSNFLLMNEGGYFDKNAEVKPLLHLWSLAVEEQFYIIWPLLIWLAWKRKFNILALILLIAISSFIFGLEKIHSNKTAAFYLPQSRFWELLIGSILAYLTIKFRPISNKILSNIASICGASLIAIAVIMLTRDKNFPGAWALLPTFGAVLLIAAGANAWFNFHILQNRILVWFGLISFPLYLWHWPLLSFARIIESERPASLIRGVAVIISILLAWLTYRFIERPIRFGKHDRLKTIILALLMMIIGLAGYECYRLEGIPSRKSIAKYQRNAADLFIPQAVKSDGSCEAYLNFQIPAKDAPICIANSAKPEILIMGDSHSMSLNSAAYLHKVELKTMLIAANDCLPFYKYSKSTSEVCRNIAVQAKLAAEKIPSIKTIIIHTYGPEDQNGFNSLELRKIGEGDDKVEEKEQVKMFVDGYEDLILQLISTGKKIIFVIDNPRLQHDPERYQERPFRAIADDGKISKKDILEAQNLYRQKVEEIHKAIPQLQIFDSAKAFCDEEFCYGKDLQNIFYYDKHHINAAGSKKMLIEIIKNDKKN